jgi:chromosome segregation ATPase
MPMTPNELQQAIEANTQAIAGLNQAVNFLVTEAVRPALQQSSANQEQLAQLIGFVSGNAEAIAALSELFESSQQQIAANTAAITALTESLAAFDSSLEDTRTLVANNASLVAQIGVKVDANANQIAANAQAISESRQETEALKELSRSQLAGIIGNGRRIDRLEQQAS